MQEIDKLFQTKDIHQLAEKLSTYLQKAIVIENDQFELVAYSSPINQSFDPVQQKTILAKRCPLYVIERLKKEGIIDRLAQNNQPIRMKPMEDIHFYERIVISLKLNNHIYGYLWVYEAEQVNAEAMDMLKNIAPHLAQSLYKQQGKKADRKQSLIWRLMNDEYLNEAEIFQAAKLAAYPIPKAFNVIVYSVLDARYVHILEKIKVTLVKQGYAFYLGKGTEIIGIIHGEDTKSTHVKTEQIIHQVEETLVTEETSSLYVGAGDAYQKIHSMRQSYLEALEVIETMIFLDGTKQKVFHFRELGIYRYAKLMYKKNVSEQYRNSKLLTLMQHDIDHNSALLKTLWYFLKSDTKVARTAEALFIHPNTLNYRMKQITELTAIDLTNMGEKAELHSQLMLIYLITDYRKFYRNGLQHRIVQQ